MRLENQVRAREGSQQSNKTAVLSLGIARVSSTAFGWEPCQNSMYRPQRKPEMLSAAR
jgi:hypothetical protein